MCTGNAIAHDSDLPIYSVYPCVYRERSKFGPHIEVALGLSLCVQGTLIIGFGINDAGRFIPVCTGNAEDKE